MQYVGTYVLYRYVNSVKAVLHGFGSSYQSKNDKN